MMAFAPAPLDLHWRQVAATPLAFELTQGSILPAELAWESASDTLALARSAHEAWTFKRVGFFDAHLTVREAGSTVDLATFRPGWRGEGELLLPTGQAWRWICTSPWGATFAWANTHGQHLLDFQPEPMKQREPFALRARLELDTLALDHEELPLLACFGWYLMVMQALDLQATNPG